MSHYASPSFWACYEELPKSVQDLADKSFELLKADSNYPSLHFKKIGNYRSARVGIHHRALAVESPDGLVWFWIGSHSDYDKIVG